MPHFLCHNHYKSIPKAHLLIYRPKKVEYEVEKIVGDKETKDGDVKYLVKWVGWNKPTWEDEANVEGCQDLLDAYYIVKDKKEKEKEERLKERENGDYEVAKVTAH